MTNDTYTQNDHKLRDTINKLLNHNHLLKIAIKKEEQEKIK